MTQFIPIISSVQNIIQTIEEADLMKKSSLKTQLLKLSVVTAIAGLTATSAYAAGIEEIIVTAQKRAESIQDVSASVTAVDVKTIARAGIDDVSRLEHLVPGLRMGQSGGEARLAMRGTRTNNVGPDAEQVVGIFQDGIYVPTTTQALGAYVDLQQIEVLRGPQGTLYGRNTFGGTINVFSAQPTFDEVKGYAEVTLGDYGKQKFQGAVNFPVTDEFAVRIAAMSDEHDGYVENTFLPGTSDDMDANDATYYRITAKLQPTENFSATLRHSAYAKDANTTAIWGYQQLGGYSNGVYTEGHPYLPADAVAPTDNGPWSVSRNFPSNARIDDKSTSVALEYEASFATAKLLHNKTDFEGYFESDFDYSNGGPTIDTVGDFAFLGRNNTQETKSTELQLISNSETAFDWMLGYYNYEQDSDWGWVSAIAGEIIPYGYGHNLFTSESEAFFANTNYAVSDRFRVNAGIRFNEDTKGGGAGATTNSWKDTLWKAGAEYDLNDSQMGYFTASTGFRAGGFNSAGVVDAIFDATGRDITSYGPEAVTAYEVGLKSTLQDGELILNVAAFLNDYTDMHAQSFFTIPGDPATSEYTENGGEVDASGLEVEIQWAPTDNWYIVANAALLNAEFGNYDIAALNGLGDLGGRSDGTVLSLEGYEPANSPGLTMGGQISYDYPLGAMGTLTPMLQFTYTSDYFSSDINLAPTQQDAHTKSDLRLIWDYDAKGIQLEAFVLNLEDEAVLNRTVPFNPGANPSVTSIQASFSRPRTWGVSARYTF